MLEVVHLPCKTSEPTAGEALKAILGIGLLSMNVVWSGRAARRVTLTANRLAQYKCLK